jgi:hypothetical protein
VLGERALVDGGEAPTAAADRDHACSVRRGEPRGVRRRGFPAAPRGVRLVVYTGVVAGADARADPSPGVEELGWLCRASAYGVFFSA